MHELSSLQCGRALQLVSFGHWLESLQPYHWGELFRETPRGFHTDGEGEGLVFSVVVSGLLACRGAP